MDSAPRSGCAINAAIEALGDPWTVLLMCEIMFGNRRHFRDLVAGRSTLTGEALAACISA